MDYYSSLANWDGSLSRSAAAAAAKQRKDMPTKLPCVHWPSAVRTGESECSSSQKTIQREAGVEHRSDEEDVRRDGASLAYLSSDGDPKVCFWYFYLASMVAASCEIMLACICARTD